MSDLLIGCGASRVRRLPYGGRKEWNDLVTVDMNEDAKPDLVWDLNDPHLPFEDSTFDEIHAYDVLEHLGQQGDWRAFFSEWSEWYRLLKPDGVLCGLSPRWDSGWAFGDPGHRRIVGPECLVYLQQPQYTAQVGVTAMTDYRHVYQADFEPVEYGNLDAIGFMYVLKAVKPSRVAVMNEMRAGKK